MKKIYTLIFTVLTTAGAMAQDLLTLPANVATEFRASDEAPQTSLRGGDVVPHWYSDFSDATLWETDVIVGNYNWIIDDTENGWFLPGNINSASGGDYAFIWNGNPQDEDEVLVQSQYTLTTADAIDVSTIETAILQYELYGARFSDSLEVQVSLSLIHI